MLLSDYIGAQNDVVDIANILLNIDFRVLGMLFSTRYEKTFFEFVTWECTF